MSVTPIEIQKNQTAQERVREEVVIQRHQQDTVEFTHAQKEKIALSAALEEMEEDLEISIERANEHNYELDQEKISAQAAVIQDQKALDPYLESLKESAKQQSATEDQCTFDFKNNTATIRSDRAYSKAKDAAQAEKFEKSYQHVFAKPSAEKLTELFAIMNSAHITVATSASVLTTQATQEQPSSRVERTASHVGQTVIPIASVVETLQAQVAREGIVLDPVVKASTVDYANHITTIEMENGVNVTYKPDPDKVSGSIYTVKHKEGLSEKAQAINTGVIMANMLAAEHENRKIADLANNIDHRSSKSRHVLVKNLAEFFTGRNPSKSYSVEDMQAIATAWKLAADHSDRFTVMAGDHIIDKASMKEASCLAQLIKLNVIPSVALTAQAVAAPPRNPTIDAPTSEPIAVVNASSAGLAETEMAVASIVTPPVLAATSAPETAVTRTPPLPNDLSAENLDIKSAAPQSSVVAAAIAKNPSVSQDAENLRKEAAAENTPPAQSRQNPGASGH